MLSHAGILRPTETHFKTIFLNSQFFQGSEALKQPFRQGSERVIVQVPFGMRGRGEASGVDTGKLRAACFALLYFAMRQSLREERHEQSA